MSDETCSADGSDILDCLKKAKHVFEDMNVQKRPMIVMVVDNLKDMLPDYGKLREIPDGTILSGNSPQDMYENWKVENENSK